MFYAECIKGHHVHAEAHEDRPDHIVLFINGPGEDDLEGFEMNRSNGIDLVRSLLTALDLPPLGAEAR